MANNGPDADDGCSCGCCVLVFLPAVALAIGVSWKILKWFEVI
jgi:hypothetical protein